MNTIAVDKTVLTLGVSLNLVPINELYVIDLGIEKNLKVINN